MSTLLKRRLKIKSELEAATRKTVGYLKSTAANVFEKRFDADVHRAAEVNQEVLKKILTLNKDTVYGQRYNFDAISTRDEYKTSVPLTTYKDYQAYIERMSQGESNILTSEPIKYFALSSGTTGTQKLIPVTSRSRRTASLHIGLLTHGAMVHAIPGLRRFDKGLMLINMSTSGSTESGVTTGSYSTAILKSLKRMAPHLWSSPLEIFQVTNQHDMSYLHLLFALKEKKLMYLISLFPSALLDLFMQLEKKWPEIIKDLASGTINKNLNLEPELRKQLEKKLLPHPDRAAELAEELKQGFEGIAIRIWPDLLLIGCITGGNFSIYTEKLRLYILDLPIYPLVYGASEAIIGISLWPGEPHYAITPRTAYHEFIPLEEVDKPDPQVCDITQIEVGKSYEVVITNFAGLYRYRLGDIIKIVDYYHASPIIEFQYRRGQLLNIAGEKTSEQAVVQALSEAIHKWDEELIDFATMLNYNTFPGKYILFVEVKDPARLADNPHNTDILEDALGRSNPRYQYHRQAKRIGPLELRIVQTGTFANIKSMLLNRGASANQVKIPRIIRDEQITNFLNESTLNDYRSTI